MPNQELNQHLWMLPVSVMSFFPPRCFSVNVHNECIIWGNCTEQNLACCYLIQMACCDSFYKFYSHPASLMSGLVCIAAFHFSSAAAGPAERVKLSEVLCVWLTAEWNRMQRLHCQPAGVSANRWGNAGAGTPKLGLPWKRFASWSPAISLQLFSFHDRSTRA